MWGDAEQRSSRSFDALKAALTSAPVLRVWDPARPTRLLTDASELAVSAILEQPDDSGQFQPRKLTRTQPERSFPPDIQELLAVVHALKALRPYLLDKPFELHTDNASLQWLQKQRHVSHHRARWLNLLAEYQYRVVHNSGRTNQADFLTRKRFLDGPGPARSTSYDDQDSELELFATSAAPPASAFVHSGPDPGTPRFLHADFAAAVRAALPADPDFDPRAAALSAQPTPLTPASGPHRSFVLRDSLLYCTVGALAATDCAFPRPARCATLCCRSSTQPLLGVTSGATRPSPSQGARCGGRVCRWQWGSTCAPALPVSASKRTICRLPDFSLSPPPSFPSGWLPHQPRLPRTAGGACGHDFLQVQLDLLPGRVWLVPTFKTATAEIAARNFVFRDVGLPEVLVSDRGARFTSAFWTSLHEALGASLTFGSPHHHNTTSKVEHINGVTADVLRCSAGDRCDDRPDFVPLAEFALNDSASFLGSGYTPFFAVRGHHPRRPLAPPDAPDPALPGDSGEAAAHLMGRITAEVRALLQERQDRRKAELDTHRWDVQFAVGDEVLLDTEHTPLPSRSLLSPRWMGPFKVLARTAPNTYLPPQA